MNCSDLEASFREWWGAQGYVAKPNSHTVNIATAWASTLLEQRQGSVKSAPSLTFAAAAADGPAEPEDWEVEVLVGLLRREADHDEISDHLACLTAGETRRAAYLLERYVLPLSTTEPQP